MGKQNYCQIGTPVQFFKCISEDHWEIHPALISNVNGANVDIRYFKNDSELAFIAYGVRHADFKLSHQDYWDYIPERHP